MTTTISAAQPFAGQTAIVTGAASGIGLATLELLHAQGARVVAVDRDEAVRALARPGVEPLVADIAKEDSAVQAVAAAIDRFGRLDILVNNAGIIINKPVIDMTLEDWNGILAVNSTGAFLFSREAMRVMVPAGHGAIVNVGSYACYQAFPTIAAYAASKGAITALTRQLAIEWGPRGITVNTLAPGFFPTELNARSFEKPGMRDRVEQLVPLARLGRPGELTAALLFLVSPAASYVTGATVLVDGGYTAW
jgi:NAD(P)-dependent dehydrogenase (short-subunit alcohol dehydrogenase family)